MQNLTTNLQGMSLRGVDRLRGYATELEFRGIERADVQVPGVNLQGLQTGAPINYVEIPNPMSDVGMRVDGTNVSPHGTFLFAPDAGGAAADLRGTFWNLVFYDTTDPNADDTHRGEVIAYIADVERDTRSRNSSTSPSNDDIWLYTVYFRQPATGQWSALCPTDEEGKARAMVTSLIPTEQWTNGTTPKLAFACTAAGVAAKCARNWGYKPWRSTSPNLMYNACLIAARADYCQDGQSFTRDGTLVDLFDFIPAPRGPDNISLNPPVGLSVNPFDRKPMLHEEYQISINDKVIQHLSDDQIANLPPGHFDLVSKLETSGLQSSRYPDLDPGRSCEAAPYVDRCTSLGVCTRAGNLQPVLFKAVMAVNSPRHCSHREDEIGEPMIPSCSWCTRRICDVDPTCCGEPDGNPFPGSLVWDERCTALRAQVCRSTPVGVGTENLWPLGVLAQGSVGKPAEILRGAVGAFEGIVSEGAMQYAEGWACDPDFPLASNPIQISVGGPLGAEATTLLTATADQQLSPSWRAIVAAECGGGERHGFRVALPDGSAGRDVFVYGIDLNVPGAPFSLLRGGKKPAPGGQSLPSPRAAIFTGWVEPAESGAYLFDVDAGSDDKFRLWVNGLYVAGNWKDPVTPPPTPDAFTLDPPPSPPMPFLQKGIRYAIRVEYLRPDTSPTGSSHLSLTWSRPTASPPVAPQPITTAALYAMAQSNGNGLQGTYFPGVTSLAALPADNSASTLPRTFGAVDHVWNDGNPPISGNGHAPIAGVSVEDSFAARFEGQLVPATSGDYTFSLDTDGTARVIVNGVQVATVTQRFDAPQEQCAHDLCVTGEAMSDWCSQNNFCTSSVCAWDPACCAQTWDARCVEAVKTRCEDDICTPTRPVGITLNAGWKYDVRVEYQHTRSESGEPVRGAKLKLMWSLASGGREVIPAARLLAGTAAPAPQLGTGLNAAYFADAQFQQPIIDRVEANLGFQAASPPVSVARPDSLICGAAGAPPCGEAPVPGAPVLAAAETYQANDLTMALILRGGGAVPGASLTVFERKQDGTLVTLGSPAVTTTAGGAFTTAPVTVDRRTYTLLARQAVNGQTSPLSAPLAVNVTDPLAPPAPIASVSATADGTVTVGGTAGSTATVNVSVKVAGTTTELASRSFTANGEGSWTGAFPLPPGSYDLTITQTLAGHTGDAGRTVSVKVPVPAVVVTAPADNLILSCPTRTCLVAVSGTGASTALGPIIVAGGQVEPDLDGVSGQLVDVDRFFVDLPTEPQAIIANGDGSFSGQVVLDHGRHRLKIFQRANGLDGEAVPRTVLVRPPSDGLVIQSPANDQVIGTQVTVIGTGPARQGLRGKLTVYQLPPSLNACPAATEPAGAHAIKIGEGTLDDDDGRFAVRVTISGLGLQCLAVSHTQSSLSGAGAVESELSQVVSVRVRPSVPKITKPASQGTPQYDSLSVAIEGRADPGTTVTVFAERPSAATITTSVLATPAGTFATTLQLPAAGTYSLTATATIDGAETRRSDIPVVIAVGDMIPPTLTVASPADPARTPVREIPVTAVSDSGVDFDFGPWVTAVDPSPSGGPGVVLDASRIVCQPLAGTPAPRFPLGATKVTCTATDDAGNRGSRTFLVVVRMTEAPFLNASNLEAEAQSPAGAVVPYGITATGLASDCAPAGSGLPQSCAAWRPASAGLGIYGQSLAIDSVTGDLYAVVYGVGQPHIVKSTNGAATWHELASPGLARILRIAVQSGSQPTLYVVPSGFGFSRDRGLRISRDGGQSWLTTLDGVGITDIAQDPSNAAHVIAWTPMTASSRSSLYETRDSGATWQDVTEGLPEGSIGSVAIDPLNADRVYLTMGFPTTDNEPRLIRIFRRTASGGAWRERPVFPFFDIFRSAAEQIFVAPSNGPCPTGEPFPAVFLGPVYSCDGGNNWQERDVLASSFFDRGGLQNMVFDKNVPGKIYAGMASLLTELLTSEDSGKTWTPMPTSTSLQIASGSLVQDPGGSTLYAADHTRGIIRSRDGGRTWTAVNNGVPPGGFPVADLAADPADPAVAYVAFGDRGVFKTSNGGESWEGSDGLIKFVAGHFLAGLFHAHKIVIHPLARNLVFSGGVYGLNFDPGGFLGLDWGTSPDGGTTWAPMVDSEQHTFLNAGLAADPLVVNGWLAFTWVYENPPTLRWPTGGADHPFVFPYSPFRLQMVPDAERTVVASLVGQFGEGGGTALFSFRDVLEGASPPPFVDTGLLGPANVVYDASDGTHRLFVGGKALGRDPHLLYRATVSDLRAGLGPDGWEPLVGDGVLPAFQRAHAAATSQEAFTTLLIDPMGGGQTMYTLGSGNTLWESRDGGSSWRRDETIPGFVTSAWLSPVDGTLYATVSETFADVSRNFYAGDASGDGPPSAPGVLWKRAPSTGVLPGVRIARGDLRVTCAGPAGFTGATVPGSTFPVGDTVLSCSATDAFGNLGSRPFTVSVRDTTPPVLTIPPDVTLTGSCTSPQNVGTATATDVASAAVTITDNRPSIFRTGTTVVTYIASDAQGNTTTGRQRVTVVLGDDPSCCPTGTTIRRGTPGNDTIVGTPGRDCILGLGGHDVILARGGNDIISGGTGRDVIDGGDGNDVIYGGDGEDICRGGDGDDTLNGGPNTDFCHGGSGNDTLAECNP